jgi:hypothetical protein
VEPVGSLLSHFVHFAVFSVAFLVDIKTEHSSVECRTIWSAGANTLAFNKVALKLRNNDSLREDL